jgi:hypothetical protein
MDTGEHRFEKRNPQIAQMNADLGTDGAESIPQMNGGIHDERRFENASLICLILSVSICVHLWMDHLWMPFLKERR